MISETKLKAFMDNLHYKTNYKECFMHDGSCNNIIKSHSVQNNRILNKLSVNGHVYQTSLISVDNKTSFDMKLIGKNDASIFYGFCGYHDDNVFKYIDTNQYVVDDLKQNFLYALRAFAREYCVKQRSMMVYDKLVKMSFGDELENELQKYADNKLTSKELDDLKKYFVAFRKGQREAIKFNFNLKKAFQENFINQRYDKIKTDVIIFDEESLISVSSVINIEYDFHGNHICRNLESKFQIKPMFITVLPENGKTYIIMSYLKRDVSQYSKIFQQIVCQPLQIQKKYISNIIANHIENVFVSPIFWNNLSKEKKALYLNQFSSTIFSANKDLKEINDINLFL